MSFGDADFLSPTMDAFRASLQQVPAYEQWFTLAKDLKTFTLILLSNRKAPDDDGRKLAILALFARAQQSFQAIIVLAELGMLSDARVVLRSAVEVAIALHGFEGDSTFAAQLVEAGSHNRRKLAHVLLGNPEYKAMHTSDEIRQMKDIIKEVDLEEKEEMRKFTDINWSRVAAKYCKDLYDFLYRMFSNDGTHVNIRTIDRFLSFDKGGKPTGVRAGPDISDMVDVLSSACAMILWASQPLIRVFAVPEGEKTLKEYFQRFGALPPDEPADVSVFSND